MPSLLFMAVQKFLRKVTSFQLKNCPRIIWFKDSGNIPVLGRYIEAFQQRIFAGFMDKGL